LYPSSEFPDFLNISSDNGLLVMSAATARPQSRWWRWPRTLAGPAPRR